MNFELDFSDGRVTSINKWFDGTLKIDENEFPFTIMANWNDWDDWTIEEVLWTDLEPENLDEVRSKLEEMFFDYFMK